jgi:hypothetical protein
LPRRALVTSAARDPHAARAAAPRSNYVMLGSTVSILGAFKGLTTTTYAFTVLRLDPSLRFWYHFYLAASGVSIGGCVIWVMHCTPRNETAVRRSARVQARCGPCGGWHARAADGRGRSARRRAAVGVTDIRRILL